MNLEAIRADLYRDEGKRKAAYTDSLGYLTIGVGRLIDSRKGGGLSDDEIDYLLNNDIKSVYADLSRRIPWFLELSEPRQRALVNMAFQLAVSGLLKFERTLDSIKKGHYATAATEMLDSVWASQTPQRAKRIAALIRQG